MKWYQCDHEGEMSDFTLEIINQCGFPGFYIWKTLWAIMTKACTPWDPGCAKYFKEYFYLQFPKIKDHRTTKKTLDFLVKSKKLFYFEENNNIYLWLFGLEEKADNWTRDVRKKIEKDDSQKRPNNAGNLKRIMEEKQVMESLQKIHKKHTPLHETPKPMQEKEHETSKPMQEGTLKTKDFLQSNLGVTTKGHLEVTSLSNMKQTTIGINNHKKKERKKTKIEEKVFKPPRKKTKPSKPKPKKKTGLEDLPESELVARLQDNQDPQARIELENRGIRVAPNRTH